MKTLVLYVLFAAVIAGSTGCCKDRVLTKPAGPKIEEYSLPREPERIHGGII